MLDQYIVVGNPIAHSKSPFIHAQFAKQTSQNLSYTSLQVGDNDFDIAVKNFIKQGGKGLNVTVPFKEQAWAIVNERSAEAEIAGAVNTITIGAEGFLRGDNTDGVGLVNDLTHNLAQNIKNKRVLVVGAGGAVRGVIGPLLKCQPSNIDVANRTFAKAQALAKIFSDQGVISAKDFTELNGLQYDIVINGTSASLSGEVVSIPEAVIKNAFCYDMMYSKAETTFMVWAKKNGAGAVVDGLGMLVEQAAAAFNIWRGVNPETQSVIAAVRESF